MDGKYWVREMIKDPESIGSYKAGENSSILLYKLVLSCVSVPDFHWIWLHFKLKKKTYHSATGVMIHLEVRLRISFDVPYQFVKCFPLIMCMSKYTHIYIYIYTRTGM